MIAIENVRLFKELEARNRDLTTTLDQQTATSEILRVISISPTETQPVFDTIVRSVHRLLGAHSAALIRLVEDQLHLVASSSTTPSGDEALRAFYPIRLNDVPLLDDALRRRQPLLIDDTETDPRITQRTREIARARGYRSILNMPLLHSGTPIGLLNVSRCEPGQFAEDETKLLRTFADQAVIAIENVRLFKELEARNRDLTATSEILQVISRSPTDVQPVFDTILANAARLCDAHRGALLLFKDGVFETGTELGTPVGLAEARKTPYRPEPHSHSLLSRIVVERRGIFEPDLRTGRSYEEREPRTVAAVELGGSRSMLAVPLLKENVLIGAITIHRPEVRSPTSTSPLSRPSPTRPSSLLRMSGVHRTEQKNEALTQAHAGH